MSHPTAITLVTDCVTADKSGKGPEEDQKLDLTQRRNISHFLSPPRPPAMSAEHKPKRMFLLLDLLFLLTKLVRKPFPSLPTLQPGQLLESPKFLLFIPLVCWPLVALFSDSNYTYRCRTSSPYFLDYRLPCSHTNMILGENSYATGHWQVPRTRRNTVFYRQARRVRLPLLLHFLHLTTIFNQRWSALSG